MSAVALSYGTSVAPVEPGLSTNVRMSTMMQLSSSNISDVSVFSTGV